VEVNETTVRLSLHLLGVSVWVGGQIVLGALVPVARAAGPDVPRALARRFGQVAWPFFALTVFTGLWNLTKVHVGEHSVGYQVTLAVKLVAVAVSGVTAFLHGLVPNPVARGVTAGLALLAALAAAFCGVLLIWGGG
jgi:putative copper export protein